MKTYLPIPLTSSDVAANAGLDSRKPSSFSEDHRPGFHVPPLLSSPPEQSWVLSFPLILCDVFHKPPNHAPLCTWPNHCILLVFITSTISVNRLLSTSIPESDKIRYGCEALSKRLLLFLKEFPFQVRIYFLLFLVLITRNKFRGQQLGNVSPHYDINQVGQRIKALKRFSHASLEPCPVNYQSWQGQRPLKAPT